LKIKKLVEPFSRYFGKKFISILPFRRNRAQKFHDSLLPLAREIYRAMCIEKDYGAELQKNDVYD
jgi:hypothetical protein